MGQKAAPLLPTVRTISGEGPSPNARYNAYVPRLVADITKNLGGEPPAPGAQGESQKQSQSQETGQPMRYCLLAAVTAGCLASAALAADARRPNIVLILADGPRARDALVKPPDASGFRLPWRVSRGGSTD